MVGKRCSSPPTPSSHLGVPCGRCRQSAWSFLESGGSKKPLTPSQRIRPDLLAGCTRPGNIWTWRGWDDLVGSNIYRRYSIFSTQMAAWIDMIHEDNVPLRDVAVWRSYVNMAATIGRSAGGPLGGLFADTVGWRWLRTRDDARV